MTDNRCEHGVMWGDRRDILGAPAHSDGRRAARCATCDGVTVRKSFPDRWHTVATVEGTSSWAIATWHARQALSAHVGPAAPLELEHGPSRVWTVTATR